jgi:hypothetical protein
MRPAAQLHCHRSGQPARKQAAVGNFPTLRLDTVQALPLQFIQYMP